MGKVPQDPKANASSATGSSYRGTFHCLHIVVAIALTAVVLILDTGDLLERIKANAAANASMFAIPSEIFSRFDSCNYNYPFFCDLKPGVAKCYSQEARDPEERAVCIAVVNSSQPDVAPTFVTRLASIPYLRVVLYSVVMLPRLPDALFQMLRDRWGEGRLEFSLGVVFLIAYITLMIVALRQKSLMGLWFFALAVVYGPYLILGIFWLLQHALLGAAPWVTAAAAYLASLLTPTGCLLISLGHTAESLAEAGKVLVKGARP